MGCFRAWCERLDASVVVVVAVQGHKPVFFYITHPSGPRDSSRFCRCGDSKTVVATVLPSPAGLWATRTTPPGGSVAKCFLGISWEDPPPVGVDHSAVCCLIPIVIRRCHSRRSPAELGVETRREAEKQKRGGQPNARNYSCAGRGCRRRNVSCAYIGYTCEVKGAKLKCIHVT